MRPSSDKVEIVKELVIMFGWKRVGIISDALIANKEQTKKLFSELRLIGITVFYYIMISAENHRDDSYDPSNLKNLIKSIKNEVRVLIIYSSGLQLEEISLILKAEKMEEGYVCIAASDGAFKTKDTQNYPNWLTVSFIMPDLNEEELVLDFNDPLFKGMNNSFSSQDEDGFSFAGEYFCFHLKNFF